MTSTKNNNFVLIDWYNDDGESRENAENIKRSQSLDDEENINSNPINSFSKNTNSFYGNANRKSRPKRNLIPPGANLSKFNGKKRKISGRSRSRSDSRSSINRAKDFSLLRKSKYPRLDVRIMRNGKEVKDDEHDAAESDGVKNNSRHKWQMAPKKGKRYEMQFSLYGDVPKYKQSKRAKENVSLPVKPKRHLVWPELDVSAVKIPQPKFPNESTDDFSQLKPVNITDHTKDVSKESENLNEMHLNEEVKEQTKTQMTLMPSNPDKIKDSLAGGKNANSHIVQKPLRELGNNASSSPLRNAYSNAFDVENGFEDSENIAPAVASASNSKRSPEKKLKEKCSKSPLQMQASNSTERDENNKENSDSHRFYPIFERALQKTPCKQRSVTPKKKTSPKSSLSQKQSLIKLQQSDAKKGMMQMIIDAGQRDFGLTQCTICGMMYNMDDAEDEIAHNKFHNDLTPSLSFPGWKKEYVVSYFADGRIIAVKPSDPKFMIKKVESVMSVIDRELGTEPIGLPTNPESLYLLFITNDKKIAGCLVAEPISEAYPVIPPTVLKNQNSTDASALVPLYCDNSKPVKALCGINRIWTCLPNRRQKIASRLLDSLRYKFIYYHVLSFTDMAFSSPTGAGRCFAESYTGMKSFLVYM